MSTQLTVIDQLKDTVRRMEPQFKSALPSHVPPERFVRVVLTALGNNPGLASLDRNSFLSACTKAAQDGLLPNGKEAALVPFKGSVQYIPMVGGILKLVRNSGELASITSHEVYKNDKFRYWVDSDGEHIEHEPNFFIDRGESMGVYALAKMKDGAVYIEFMSNEQLSAVEKMSRASDGPWKGPFRGEMKKKTVLRRLSKRLPLSTDLESVFSADDGIYDIQKQESSQDVSKDTVEPVKKKKSSKLSSIVGEEKQEIQEAETIGSEEIPL